MTDVLVRRRVLQLPGRRVHLRTAGSGPCVLLIHGSPANSEYFLPLIADLAAHYCCIAPDTPGFGDSDPLSGTATIAALALASGELIEQLGCAPCMLLGSHTGAAIALELAALRPDLVGGLILDGVPLFTDAESREHFDGYFEPVIPDARGGHYARTWTRIRDMFLWFPWTSHDPSRLNGSDLPPPTTTHLWVSMLYKAAPHYAEPYRAAIAYGPRAHSAAATQPRPALYLAHDRDMLNPHLQRLPPLKPVDRIASVSAAPGVWLQAVRDGLARCVASERVATSVVTSAVQGDSDFFADLPHGQLRVRRFGAPGGRPLLLLHEAPGSGQLLAPLAQALALATDVTVWVPDLPGCAGSAPLAVASPALGDYATALLPWLEQFNSQPAIVYGRGSGAALALQLTASAPRAVAALWLDELPAPGADGAPLDSRICPEVNIDADGAYWFRTWQMLRDSLIYWPWYATRAVNLLRLPGDYSAEHLHQWTQQSLLQPATMHCLPRAAVVANVMALLAATSAPVVLLARRGHPLLAAAESYARRTARAAVVAIDEAERAATLRQLLVSQA
jgi:pimeloyl-ACP methyl ester carboxylesterase